MMPLILAAAFKGTFVLALAWVAVLLLRNSSASLRHGVWLAALACLPLFLIPVRMPEAARVNVTYTAESLATTATRAPFPWVYVWGAVAALLLARFAWNLIRLARITWRAEVWDVRISDEIASPMTWGFFRPVILLPSYAADWTLAIQHERLHIARADWLTQSFAQVVSAIFWFHPLVWLAASRLRAEAEQSVDDAVLASGADASDYAAQLVAVARRMSEPSPEAAIAMVRCPELVSRIAGILDATRIRQSSRWTRIGVGLAALCIVPLLAAFQEKGPVYPIGGGVSRPEVVYQVEPIYSQEARDAKYQGEVWLSVVIDASGVPAEIKVTRSLGLGLDEKAIEAVKQWRFKPGEKDGAPVAVTATIAISFHLLDPPTPRPPTGPQRP